MSYFTPNDAAYIKEELAYLLDMSHQLGFHQGVGADVTDLRRRCDGDVARLVAFIDGCTLEGQGHDRT